MLNINARDLVNPANTVRLLSEAGDHVEFRGSLNLRHVVWISIALQSEATSNIRMLALRYTGIDRDGMLLLAGALRINDSITDLDLMDVSSLVDPEVMGILIGALEINNSITTLRFGEGLGHRAGMMIAHLLEINHTITHLYLSMAEIGSEAAIAIVRASTHIVELDLSWNNIDAEGARELVNALPGLAITSLSLRRNEILPETVRGLLEILPRTNITSLDLIDSLRERGIEALIPGLVGSQVTTLSIGGDDVFSTEDIIRILRDENAITELRLQFNLGSNGFVISAAELVEIFRAASESSHITSLYIDDNRVVTPEERRAFLYTHFEFEEESEAQATHGVTAEEESEAQAIDGVTAVEESEAQAIDGVTAVEENDAQIMYVATINHLENIFLREDDFFKAPQVEKDSFTSYNVSSNIYAVNPVLEKLDFTEVNVTKTSDDLSYNFDHGSLTFIVLTGADGYESLFNMM